MGAQLTALSIMRDAPVIPVIVLNKVEHAVPMAEALVAGGIRVLEVTLRTPQGLACIEAIAKAVPQAIVGAGTVRSAADAAAAAQELYGYTVTKGYDIIGMLAVLFCNIHSKSRWFCSEWCAQALGLPDPHNYTPAGLAREVTRNKR